MSVTALLDLLRKNPNIGGLAFNSRSLFSVNSLGHSAAAASFAICTPFAFGALFGNGKSRVAYCDAGTAALDEDFISSIRTASEKIFHKEALLYTTKEYDVQMKPLFSAFHWKTLALTSLRSFLLFYLPLLEPRSLMEEDDEGFLQENIEDIRIDLVVPFKKSVEQITRETTVVTTRRVLERLAAHYVSQRMAWKLLKDVPRSAVRKAGRGMPISTYIFCVSRTTCRDVEMVDTTEQLRILGKKVNGATIRCGACLIFASIGAGIGATIFRPNIGQWIGCAAGDLAGPVVIAFCFEKLHVEL